MKQLLLVDDDDALRSLFAMVFRREGYGVTEAADGVQALSKLEQTAFDAVIVDVMMPMLDGVRLLTLAREELELQTPILMLTSVDRRGAEAEFLALGANDVAFKPMNHNDLLGRVQTLLGQ